MTAAPPAERRLTVAEYHALGEDFFQGRRTELIRGVIYEQTIRSPEHNYLADSLEQDVTEALTPGLLLRRERGMTLADSELEPDLAVVTGRDRAEYRRHHPSTALLVMEVSVTTEERDREKIAIYAAANVQEYWIVLPGRARIEVYGTPQGGYYTRMRVCRVMGDAIVSEVLSGLQVDLGALLAEPDEE